MGKEQISNELKALCEQYASLEQMAEVLRRADSAFENINRATIHRWLENPSKRATKAIHILKSNRMASCLRIAEPDSLLVLGSTILSWKKEKNKPYGALEELYGIKLDSKPVDTGQDALNCLQKGEVDIALLAPELLQGVDRAEYYQLCTLSKAYLIGIATKKVEGLIDLKDINFGCFAGSIVPHCLNEMRRKGIDFPPPEEFADPAAAKAALISKKINGFVAWEPVISDLKNADPDLKLIQSHMFGPLEIIAVVKARTANPGLIRAYLHCLSKATEYIKEHQTSEEFISEIAKQPKMPPPAIIKNVLKDIIFFISVYRDINGILALWEREVSQLNSNQI